MKLTIIIILIGLCACNAFGKVEYLPMEQTDADKKAVAAFGKVALHFVENKGQYAKNIFYYAKSEGTTVYCTDEGIAFGFTEGSIRLKFASDRCVKPKAQGKLVGKVKGDFFWK